MMDDLINRKALLSALYERAFECDEDTSWNSGLWIRYRLACNVIKDQPAAYTTVIRCKDCMHRETSWKTRTKGLFFCPMIDRTTAQDFFCAYGEKEDPTNES